MAVRVADTLKQQNDLTSFPVAYAEGIWVNTASSGEPSYKTLQELYATNALGGTGSSTYELSFDEASAELTIAFN